MKELFINVIFASLVAFCVTWGVVQAQDWPSSQQTKLYTASGGTLGFIDADTGGYQAVRNSSKRVIGYINNRGTYDTSKKRILNSKLPGYLFCK